LNGRRLRRWWVVQALSAANPRWRADEVEWCIGNMAAPSDHSSNVAALAARFGKLVRQRRESLNMRPDDLALVTGLGRCLIIELEKTENQPHH
jgi:hypothetical protein